MPNPLRKILNNSIGQKLAGIAQDYWKDSPCEFPDVTLKVAGRSFTVPNYLKPMPPQPDKPQPITPRSVAVAATPMNSTDVPAPIKRPPWHAAPGEISEKMWGEGNLFPGDDAVFDMLTTPLKLTNDKNVLDLSAGLGTYVRKLIPIVNELKGLESDAVIASRGMELSVSLGKEKKGGIAHYDPATFSMPAIYHCMIARQLFYRVPDKGQFFYSIGAGIKIGGSTTFTDFIVNPEDRHNAAILKWQEQERDARPLGLIEMAEAWAKVGFEIRKSDDRTDFYRREIVHGFNRLVGALRQSGKPVPDTKQGIMDEVEKWIYRLAAIQQGLKFYVFHAVKS